MVQVNPGPTLPQTVIPSGWDLSNEVANPQHWCAAKEMTTLLCSTDECNADVSATPLLPDSPRVREHREALMARPGPPPTNWQANPNYPALSATRASLEFNPKTAPHLHSSPQSDIVDASPPHALVHHLTASQRANASAVLQAPWVMS